MATIDIDEYREEVLELARAIGVEDHEIQLDIYKIIYSENFVQKIWRFIKGYFSGEWGKPGPKAKRDMIFFAKGSIRLGKNLASQVRRSSWCD